MRTLVIWLHYDPKEGELRANVSLEETTKTTQITQEEWLAIDASLTFTAHIEYVSEKTVPELMINLVTWMDTLRSNSTIKAEMIDLHFNVDVKISNILMAHKMPSYVQISAANRKDLPDELEEDL